MRGARGRAAVACCALAAVIALPATAAGGPREVHGSADAYAAPGIALAWGVLRGASEAATVVVVRVAADPSTYGALAVSGRDPFTDHEASLFPRTPLAGTVDIRVPRGRFAEFPRTEWRFDGPATPSDGKPALVVFYLGVPDTTPEFASADKLEAYLADRINRLRNSPGSKAP